MEDGLTCSAISTTHLFDTDVTLKKRNKKKRDFHFVYGPHARKCFYEKTLAFLIYLRDIFPFHKSVATQAIFSV